METTETRPAAAGNKRFCASFLKRRGMEIALDMLGDLEEKDGDGNPLADACQLEVEYSQGLPFRNIVHERLQIARRAGPEAEEGFCALLCEVVALNALGFAADISDLERTVREQVANA